MRYEPIDILKKLLSRTELRYEHLGYGRLRCRSCGAWAYENFDGYGVDIKKEEECSPVCPWQLAEDAIKDVNE